MARMKLQEHRIEGARSLLHRMARASAGERRGAGRRGWRGCQKRLAMATMRAATAMSCPPGRRKSLCRPAFRGGAGWRQAWRWGARPLGAVVTEAAVGLVERRFVLVAGGFPQDRRLIVALPISWSKAAMLKACRASSGDGPACRGEAARVMTDSRWAAWPSVWAFSAMRTMALSGRQSPPRWRAG